MTDLKPCPLCSSANVVLDQGWLDAADPKHRTHEARCQDCGCSGPCSVNRAESIAAWNRRAEPPAPAHGDVVPRDVAESWRARAENLAEERATLLDDIAIMMSKHVENWPEPKRIKTAIALIDKTLAAMPDDRASAWRTMDSAPKDGSPILIYLPNDDRKPVQEVWWAYDYEGAPGYWMTPVSVTGRGYTILPNAPTHWQSLPTPPAIERGADREDG